ARDGERAYLRVGDRIVNDADIGIAVRDGVEDAVGAANLQDIADGRIDLHEIAQGVLDEIGQEAFSATDADAALLDASQLIELLGDEGIVFKYPLAVLEDQLSCLGQ